MKNEVVIYGIPNCDTMKKAFTWLDANKVEYRFHNYRADGISSEKIQEWFKVHPIDKVINLNSTTFKELTEKQRASIKDPAKAIKLIQENTSIVKRPLFEYKKGILLGFKAAVWEEELL
jgi:arsenate reductase